jgi:hypothetical protein
MVHNTPTKEAVNTEVGWPQPHGTEYSEPHLRDMEAIVITPSDGHPFELHPYQELVPPISVQMQPQDSILNTPAHLEQASQQSSQQSSGMFLAQGNLNHEGEKKKVISIEVVDANSLVGDESYQHGPDHSTAGKRSAGDAQSVQTSNIHATI